MNTTDRLLCRVTSRWLHACARHAGALGTGAGAVAALGLLLVAAPPAAFAAVLLLVLPERLLALRLGFDAGLFADLADATDDAPAPLRALDTALLALGLRTAAATATPRGLADRVAGARRLARQHLGLVVVQAAVLALALGQAMAGRAA